MPHRTRAFAAIVATLPLTAACGGGGGDSSSRPPPVVTPPSPPAVVLEAAFPALGFQQPVAMLQAPGDDRRWFVVEQRGTVRVFDNDPAAAETRVFLDLSPVVTAGGETGLLGMAFDPDFARSGEAYLSYTGSPGGALTSIVARYRSRDGGETLAPDGGETVLAVVQDFGNHNGGQIAFGPDGHLYVGLGDGGSANDPNDRAQDVSNLLGAMLRIDVAGAPYGIPPDNPFAGNAPCVQGFGGAPCPELYAWGLRNPWRWSFDRRTGDLWLGDVGQSSREEINLVRRGENYGWRIREGSRCNDGVDVDCDAAGLTDPVWEYGRDQGRSVTGGIVYRGRAIPGLDGFYLFGDFITGRIWALPVDGSAPATEILDSGLPVASFAEDAAGEVYVVAYSGALFRLLAAP